MNQVYVQGEDMANSLRQARRMCEEKELNN